MIRWKEIDDALGAVVSAALKAANLPAVRERKDVKAPLVRRSYRIDVGQTDGMGTDDYAETGCDIEIYFYPADGTRPRDELNTAADAIRAALREGVTVQDVVLIPEDDIACDADGETLGTYVPDAMWDFLKEQYGCDKNAAVDYLSQYLDESLASAYDTDDAIIVDQKITQVDDYEAEDMADMNDGLDEYGLSGDDMKDVYSDLEITYGDESDSQSSSVILTQIDGKWYIYDCMYYLTEACYYYGDGI